MGGMREVEPVERYRHYAVDGVPLYACRTVDKTSSKGRLEPRVLVLNQKLLWLASTTSQKVHRLVVHGTVTQARFKRSHTGAPLIHLQMSAESAEPDILFRQTGCGEQAQEVGDGVDVLHMLNELHTQCTGQGFRIVDLTGTDVPLNERTCALQKGKGYATPKRKVARGYLRMPLSPRSEPGEAPVPAVSPAGGPQQSPAVGPQTSPAVGPQPSPAVGPQPSPAVAPQSSPATAPEPIPQLQVIPPVIGQVPPSLAPAPSSFPPPPSNPRPYARRYTVTLSSPVEELGVKYRAGTTDGVPEVTIVGCRPGGPWARADVPLGVLHSFNGVDVQTVDHLTAAVQSVRTQGLSSFQVEVTPVDSEPAAAPASQPTSIAAPSPVPPPSPHPPPRVVQSRALVVGVAYTDTPYILAEAPGRALEFARVLQQRGAVAGSEVMVLLEDAAGPPEQQPTFSNVMQGLQWLVSEAGPGSVRYLVFVGHAMNLRGGEAGAVRDGPGEALYPCDFQNRRVVPQEEVLSALEQMPADSRVVMLCDSAATGTLVDLPYKLKAQGATPHETVAGAQPIAAECACFSFCRAGECVDAPSGTLVGSVAEALSQRGAEPSVSQLLTSMRRSLIAACGPSAPVPMVSSSVSLHGGARPAGWLPPSAADPPSPVAATPSSQPPLTPGLVHQRHVVRLLSADEQLGLTYTVIRDGFGGPSGPLTVAAVDGPCARAGIRPPCLLVSLGGYMVNDNVQVREAERAWRATGSLECVVVTASTVEPAAAVEPAPAEPEAVLSTPAIAPSSALIAQQPPALTEHSMAQSVPIVPSSHRLPQTPAPTTAAAAPYTDALLQGLPALSPDELLRQIPRALTSPGFAKILSVRRPNGVPELFFAAEVVVQEASDDGSRTGLWPSVKFMLVGRQALYLLEPSGELDRCVAICDLQDFVLLRGGAVLDASGVDGGPYTLPGGADSPWLAVRIPSQYELLMQPTPGGGQTARQTIQDFLQVLNVLLQQGTAAAAPARVLVVERNPAPGLLRLRRPAAFSYPWIPLAVRIWPAGRVSSLQIGQ